MSNEPSPTYEETQRRLADAEGELQALRNGRVDTVAGGPGNPVARPAEAEAQANHIKQVLLAIRNVNQLIVSEDDPLRDLHRTQALAQVGSWCFDLSSRRVIASDETRRIYGLDQAEWSIEHIQAIPLKQYRAALDHGLNRLVKEGGSYDIVFQILRPSDQAIRDIHSVAEFDAARNLVFGTIQDITDRKSAEAALRQKHEMHSRTERIAHVGSWEWDIADDRVRWSDELFHIFQRDASLGAPSFAEHADLYVAEDLHNLRQAVERCRTNGTAYELELRAIRADGEVRHCVARGQAQIDADGRIRHLAGSLQDITERKEREDRIALLGQMLDAAPASITIHNPEGRFLFANRITASLHGYGSEAEFLGVNLHDLDVPESETLLAEHLRQIAEQGEARFEVAHHRKDGSVFPMEVLAKRIEWHGQSAILSVATDISERKRSEHALRESEERNRLLSDVTMEGILLHENGVALDLNSSLARMLGFEREELLNKNFLEWVHEDDRAMVRANIAKETAPPYTVRMARKTGEWFFAEIESRNFQRQGEVWRVSAVRDITERKRAEEEREKLQAQLTQAQRMESVGRLAGGVAHDFNNMLQAILGNAALALLDLPAESPLRESLEGIQKSAQRSADLTRQLLAFARKQTTIPKVLDLNETVEGMLKMLRRLIGENVDLAWLPSKHLGPVKMDPSQIDQILANLCVNARDAIGEVGKVTLETDNLAIDEAYVADHPDAVAGNYVRLSVSDNGCGMDKETLARLFEPFFTTKAMGKGTGLGLATVYGIVKQNGGFISVYSEPGHGTTFRLYLPRHADKAAPLDQEGPARTAGRGHETILLVEDEPAILRISQRILANLGYTVLAASTPGEALRLSALHAGQIHLLITDVVMPEMNGRELAKRLLSLYPDLKRLFMSGYTADVIAHHGVLDPGVHFIQKPFSIPILAGKVREALDPEREASH